MKNEAAKCQSLVDPYLQQYTFLISSTILCSGLYVVLSIALIGLPIFCNQFSESVTSHKHYLAGDLLVGWYLFRLLQLSHAPIVWLEYIIDNDEQRHRISEVKSLAPRWKITRPIAHGNDNLAPRSTACMCVTQLRARVSKLFWCTKSRAQEK